MLDFKKFIFFITNFKIFKFFNSIIGSFLSFYNFGMFKFLNFRMPKTLFLLISKFQKLLIFCNLYFKIFEYS
jgi:hypothetical protein